MEGMIKQQNQCDIDDIWNAEAKFGFEQISPYVRDLHDGARVLEIGSGKGILLTHLIDLFAKNLLN